MLGSLQGWTWKQCSGKLSKKCWDNHISRFEAVSVPLTTITQAHRRLKDFNVDVTQQNSIAAFDLYTWVSVQ